jgi:hypothetical protein
MSRIKQGDSVWVGQDPYDDIPQTGYATVTGAPENGLVCVQFEPVLVSQDRVHLRAVRGGR